MILITKTIKIELTNEEILLFACAGGDVVEAKRLLSTGQDINTTDRYGHSLLWLACYRNQTEVVKLLLTYTNLNESKELSRDMTAIFKEHNNATKLFLSQYQGLYFHFCILWFICIYFIKTHIHIHTYTHTQTHTHTQKKKKQLNKHFLFLLLS